MSKKLQMPMSYIVAVQRQDATEEKGLVTVREQMEDPLFLRHILKSLHAEEQFASGKWRI